MFKLATSIFLVAVLLSHGPQAMRSAPASRSQSMPLVVSSTFPVAIESHAGFTCKSFVLQNHGQSTQNILFGERACSGEILNRISGKYRALDYIVTDVGLMPVVIHSPTHNWENSRGAVVYVPGGPRTLVLANPSIDHLVNEGFTVLVPLYLGKIETRHPEPDLPIARMQVRRLEKLLGSRLIATIGISAGGYLAVAACRLSCLSPLILLAPLMTTPRLSLSVQKLGLFQTRNICVTKCKQKTDVCKSQLEFVKSFWGPVFYDVSLPEMIGKLSRCAEIFTIVSTTDTRAYDAGEVAKLRSLGCEVDEKTGIAHGKFDSDANVSDSVIRLLDQFTAARRQTAAAL